MVYRMVNASTTVDPVFRVPGYKSWTYICSCASKLLGLPMVGSAVNNNSNNNSNDNDQQLF